ncbi:MAG: hypothetical protein ACM31C_14525 [Acidobacteriota bacterium]
MDAPHHAPDAPAADAHRPPDAAVDAGCPIAAGMTPALSGTNDLAAYPAAQHVALGAMLGSDAAAIAWDRAKLYVTVTSSAFTSAYEPLHVYVEAGTALAAAAPSTGKEYGGLVPQLPFTPTHLIAARRVSDSGSGTYDAIYTPATSWTVQEMPLVAGSDVLVSSDQQTLSIEAPWSALGGCPTTLRLAVHVVHGAAGNEWKDLAPTTHTPWQAPGGDYYEIDLTGSTAVASWTVR